MQRTEDDGVIISCDFCGVDWDPYDEGFSLPMVEGHHGSVMCLECMKSALVEKGPAEEGFKCPMCLQEFEGGTESWVHSGPNESAGLNVGARACRACIRQAAGRFNRDKDVVWEWVDR